MSPTHRVLDPESELAPIPVPCFDRIIGSMARTVLLVDDHAGFRAQCLHPSA